MEKRVQAEAAACSEVRKSNTVAVTGTGLEKGSRQIHAGEKSC